MILPSSLELVIMNRNFLVKSVFFFSLIALAISLSLLVYIVYRSEIHWNGSERDYYFKYIVASLFLTIFWLVAFLFDYRKRAYIILYFCCFILAFYFFEGYLIYTKSNSNILRKKLLCTKLLLANLLIREQNIKY